MPLIYIFISVMATANTKIIHFSGFSRKNTENRQLWLSWRFLVRLTGKILVTDFSALRLALLLLDLGAWFDLDRHGLRPLRYVDYDFIYSLCHSMLLFVLKRL